MSDPNKAATKVELIRLVPEFLSWQNCPPRRDTKLHEDGPDHLPLFDTEAKEHTAARKRPEDKRGNVLVIGNGKHGSGPPRLGSG